jgi:hypothetical protein
MAASQSSQQMPPRQKMMRMSANARKDSWQISHVKLYYHRTNHLEKYALFLWAVLSSLGQTQDLILPNAYKRNRLDLTLCVQAWEKEDKKESCCCAAAMKLQSKTTGDMPTEA